MSQPRDSGDFARWAEQFAATELGAEALEGLKDLDTGDLDAYGRLRERVLKACYRAQSLRNNGPAADDFERQHDRAKAFVASAPELRKALRRLQRSAAADPYHFAIAASQSAAILNVQARPGEDKPDAIARTLHELFGGIESGIARLSMDTRITAGAIAGCLEYRRDIRNQRARPDYAENGLIYELALVFKHWTAHQQLEIALPAKMPNWGRASFKHVAMFANATLGQKKNGRLRTAEDASDKLKKLIANHRGIRYVGWSD